MTVYHFQPDHYFNTIGAHEPVLTLDPGDRVITTTVDALGRDHTGYEVTPPGNPMTGPFFIRGAEPGDMLTVRLVRITPNRTTGWASKFVDPSLVDPWYMQELALPALGQPFEPVSWHIDNALGKVTLDVPTFHQRILDLPLDPMLGCFGVAPGESQLISTGTSGPYGGNMDYRGFRAGVIVHFPVSLQGALFFLGDGHAAQSDGEITGSGVEVSMEVEFQVDLTKNKMIHWPRGENAIEIFTTGNARPLLQAVQHATTEMLRWIRDDYHLDSYHAGLLIGQAVEYEIGNVFDPAFTVVCKLKKEVLFQI